LEDLGLDGRILKWILKKWDVRVYTRFIWLRIDRGWQWAVMNTVINI
jgi:hypothetical protein